VEDIVDKLEKIDMWKIYLNIKTGSFVEFQDDYNEDEDIFANDTYIEEDALENVFAIEDNWEEYVPLPSPYDMDEHTIMKAFTEQLDDAESRLDLLGALSGNGALQRFKNTVGDFGLREAWQNYRNNALRQIAEIWCEENRIPYQYKIKAE
jgi:hypothetical protein